MSTPLLDTLSDEIDAFNRAGVTNIAGLVDESASLLSELKLVETTLEQELANENKEASKAFVKLDKSVSGWYKNSITDLKGYNSQINKFSKNILNHPKYNVDLDDAYPFALNMNTFPVQESNSEQPEPLDKVKQENHTELLKAIVLHLLKIGQSDIVKEIVPLLFKDQEVIIDESLLGKFKSLNEIVDDIIIRHDLTKVLQWFKDKYNKAIEMSSRISHLANPRPTSNYDEIEFKFHILQFTLLLNGSDGRPTSSLDSALSAYLYSKENFPRFFKDYIHEISPLMTLLLFKANENDDDDDYTKRHMINLLAEFDTRMKQNFDAYREKKKGQSNESQFVSEVLTNYRTIHKDQSLFINIANEFISEYCKDMKLSSDSSLFQVLLAGLIYLPNFYKYKSLQRRLSKSRASISLEVGRIDMNAKIEETQPVVVEAPYNFDLPFLLPDSNRFLFKYHPIFICPVSKEQLIPITASNVEGDDEHKRKRNKSDSDLMYNPVVVLDHCQHVALKDSVWQLSRRGAEIFKCHYCYKRHKFSEVSDVYFIDL